MTEGRDRHTWSVASALMSLIANCHKDAKSKTYSANDFNPTLTRKEKQAHIPVITDENAELMRDEFKYAFGGLETRDSRLEG